MPEKALPRLLPEVAEDALNAVLDKIPELTPAEARDILFQSKQSTLGKAILADLADLIPVAGDISNYYRVKDAAKYGRTRPRRLARQMVDLVGGVLPSPLDLIMDLITPTNTLTYLREEVWKK